MAKAKKDRGRFVAEERVLARTSTRLAGMTSIDPKLDLTSGVSVSSITKAGHDMRSLITQLGQLESKVQETKVLMAKQSKVLRDLNDRSLSMVRGRWGADSEQYKQVGGTRSSERRKETAESRTTRLQKAKAAKLAAQKAAAEKVRAVDEAQKLAAVPPNGVPMSSGNGLSNGHSS